jgi:hypothetical protein
MEAFSPPSKNSVGHESVHVLSTAGGGYWLSAMLCGDWRFLM